MQATHIALIVLAVLAAAIVLVVMVRPASEKRRHSDDVGDETDLYL